MGVRRVTPCFPWPGSADWAFPIPPLSPASGLTHVAAHAGHQRDPPDPPKTPSLTVQFASLFALLWRNSFPAATTQAGSPRTKPVLQLTFRSDEALGRNSKDKDNPASHNSCSRAQQAVGLSPPTTLRGSPPGQPSYLHAHTSKYEAGRVTSHGHRITDRGQ